MYEFWYYYMKLKYSDNVKLCYTDTGSFIINIKTKDFLKILLMMLRIGLILEIMKMIDHYQLERIRK